MERKHTFWATFGEKVRISLDLSYWSPLDKLEIRRSLRLERLHNFEVPCVSIVIAN